MFISAYLDRCSLRGSATRGQLSATTHFVLIHQVAIGEMQRGQEQVDVFAIHPLFVEALGKEPTESSGIVLDIFHRILPVILGHEVLSSPSPTVKA